MNKTIIRIRERIALSTILLFLPAIIFAQREFNTIEEGLTAYEEAAILLPLSSNIIHKIGIEARYSYVFPTNIFLSGYNEEGRYIDRAYSAHLRYAFQFKPNTCAAQIYNGPYQGIGLAYYDFNEPKSLGEPIALYIFQGARIAQLGSRFSLNYEWNFGFSFGWKPYDPSKNSYNMVIGSRTNAYLNANVCLNWMLSKQIDLTAGAALTHFSNGNTNFPNAGLNTLDFKIGLTYNLNREENTLTKPLFCQPIPAFKRHISYDVVLFGSWRRKGVTVGEIQIASPDKYTVLGFNFNPMYNFGYRFRAGISLDGVYDGSANVYADEFSSSDDFFTPPLDRQLALGVSGRAEYVMPYFTVGLGLGVNALHRGGDFKAIYQILALKIEVTRNSFLHIGYSLNDFHDPNYLMLGLGYRFNNKSPKHYRRK